MAEVVSLDWDPRELTALLAFLKGSDKALAKTLRTGVRNAAKIVQADVAKAIMAYPAARYQTGMRSELAASLAIRIASSAKSTRVGVQLVNTGRLLPVKKQALVKAMNAATEFRHPIWHMKNKGNPASRLRFLHKKNTSPREWASQKSMRYFRAEVVRQHEATVVELIGEAVNEAMEGL